MKTFCKQIEKPLYIKGLSLTKVENVVAKGEIAQYEQFRLLATMFSRVVCCKGSESIFMWERVTPFLDIYSSDFKNIQAKI